MFSTLGAGLNLDRSPSPPLQLRKPQSHLNPQAAYIRRYLKHSNLDYQMNPKLLILENRRYAIFIYSINTKNMYLFTSFRCTSWPRGKVAYKVVS